MTDFSAQKQSPIEPMSFPKKSNWRKVVGTAGLLLGFAILLWMGLPLLQWFKTGQKTPAPSVTQTIREVVTQPAGAILGKAFSVQTIITQGTGGGPGAPGPQGQKGDQGDQGPAGFSGSDGIAGPAGPAGAAGSTGDTGSAGAAGATGATGATGPQGPSGSGSCPTCFINDGNAYGVGAVLGTTDNNTLSLITNGVEKARILTNGNFGVGVTSPTALLSVGAATTGRSSFNIAASSAVDPTSPNAGDLWFNGTNLNFYDGTSTTDLLAGGSCPTCFVQNGNAFGATGVFGTTDSNNLNFITNNATRMAIDAAQGQVAFFGNSGGSDAISIGAAANVDALGFNRDIMTGGIYNSSLSAFQLINTNSNSLALQVYDGAGSTVTNNALTVNGSDGDLGVGVSDPTAYLSLAAPTTGQSSLQLRPSSAVDPTSPNAGDLWFNGTNLNFYDGTSTTDLLAGGGGGCPTCFAQSGNAFGADAVLGTTDNNVLTFITDGSEAARILANGNFGIGVTNPTGILSVAGSDTGRASVHIDTGTAPTSPNPGDIWFNGTDLMAETDTSTINLTGGGGSCPSCFLQNGNAFAAMAILGTSDDNDLSIITNNVEAIRIKDDGKVGIGTNTPDANLSLEDTYTTSDGTNPTPPVLDLLNSDGSAGLEFRAGGSGLANSFVGYQAGALTTSGHFNNALGYQALASNQGGAYNVGIGYQAINANSNAVDNIGIGYQALGNGTSGSSNIAIGFQSLLVNTANFNIGIGESTLAQNSSGVDNVAIGYATLSSNQGGSSNLALGYNAMLDNTSGYQNVAFGESSMGFNQTGAGNVAIGYQTMLHNLTNENTGVGFQSMFTNSTGTSNSAFGFESLYANDTGSQNTAIGNQALATNTANDNTAVGFQSLFTNSSGVNNSAFGPYALYSNDTGNDNVAVGVQALNGNLADNNNGFGYQAMFTNSTGTGNNAFGTQALYHNDTGNANNAFGFNALINNVADNNNAFGYQALFTNSTGIDNAAFGTQALSSNDTGNANSAFGFNALLSNLGDNNSAFGYQALVTNTGGIRNSAFGTSSLSSNQTGNNNSAYGDLSLSSNTTGSDNTALGFEAMHAADGGSGNAAVGEYALYNNAADNNSALGKQALNTNNSGTNNAAVGFQSLYTNSSGANNVAVGPFALYSNDTGSNNVAVGMQALNESTGDTNTALGYQAMQDATSGSGNIGIGQQSLQNNTADDNIAIGTQALNTNDTGTDNIAVGLAALFNNDDGNLNSAFGKYALNSNVHSSNNAAFGSLALQNSDADNNNAFGVNALNGNQTGTDNSAFGTSALFTNQAGSGNVAIGGGALQDNNDATGANTGLGFQAGQHNTGTGNLFLGYQAGQNETGDNTLYIANSSTSTPLIFGNFAAPALSFNGDVTVPDYRVALWDASIDPTSYLRIDNSVNPPGSGNIYPIYVTSQPSDGGNDWGIRSVINVPDGQDSGSIRAIRGEVNFNTSGAMTGSNDLYGVSGLVTLNDGTVPNVRGGSFAVVNNGTEVTGALAGAISAVTDLSLVDGSIEGSLSSATASGSAATHDLYGLIGESFNHATVNNDMLGSQFGAVNQTDGTVNDAIFGSQVNSANEGTLNGDIYGTSVNLGLGPASTTTGNAYVSYFYLGEVASKVSGDGFGTYIGNIDNGDSNDYGLYIEGASGGSGTNAALYVNSGSSFFGGQMIQNVSASGQYAATFFNSGATDTSAGLLVRAGEGDGGSDTTSLIDFENNSGTPVGSITFNGTTTSFNTTSDRRVKQDITPTDLTLDTLMHIQVVDYHFINAPNVAKTHGVIAQDLFQVYPQAVTVPADANKLWSVDYSKLVPLLIKGVQQQQSEIDLLSQESTASATVQPADLSQLGNWDNSIWTFITEVVFSAKAKFTASVEFFDTVIFHNRVTFGDQDMAGSVTIQTGQVSAQVQFVHPYDVLPIVTATPQGQAVAVAVDQLNSQGFWVKISTPVSQPLVVNWVALSVAAANTNSSVSSSTSPTPTPSIAPTVDVNSDTTTPSPSPSIIPSASPTASDSATPTPTATPIPSPTATPTPTASPTASGSAQPSSP